MCRSQIRSVWSFAQHLGPANPPSRPEGHARPPSLQQVQIKGLPQWLLSSFTLGVWERPRGGYGHRLLTLVHGGVAIEGGFASCWASTTSTDRAEESRIDEGVGDSGSTAEASMGSMVRSSRGSAAGKVAAAAAVSALEGKEHRWVRDSSLWGDGPPKPRDQIVNPAVHIVRASGTVRLDFNCGASHVPSAGCSASATAAQPSGKLGLTQQGRRLHEATIEGGTGVVIEEGDLKIQLFSGRCQMHEPVFMHSSSQFYAWVSTPPRVVVAADDLHGNAGSGVADVVLPQSQLDKVAHRLRSRSNLELTVSFTR